MPENFALPAAGSTAAWWEEIASPDYLADEGSADGREMRRAEVPSHRVPTEALHGPAGVDNSMRNPLTMRPGPHQQGPARNRSVN
jgi:hypothetical protein